MKAEPRVAVENVSLEQDAAAGARYQARPLLRNLGNTTWPEGTAFNVLGEYQEEGASDTATPRPVRIPVKCPKPTPPGDILVGNEPRLLSPYLLSPGTHRIRWTAEQPKWKIRSEPWELTVEGPLEKLAARSPEKDTDPTDATIVQMGTTPVGDSPREDVSSESFMAGASLLPNRRLVDLDEDLAAASKRLDYYRSRFRGEDFLQGGLGRAIGEDIATELRDAGLALRSGSEEDFTRALERADSRLQMWRDQKPNWVELARQVNAFRETILDHKEIGEDVPYVREIRRELDDIMAGERGFRDPKELQDQLSDLRTKWNDYLKLHRRLGRQLELLGGVPESSTATPFSRERAELETKVRELWERLDSLGPVSDPQAEEEELAEIKKKLNDLEQHVAAWLAKAEEEKPKLALEVGFDAGGREPESTPEKEDDTGGKEPESTPEKEDDTGGKEPESTLEKEDDTGEEKPEPTPEKKDDTGEEKPEPKPEKKDDTEGKKPEPTPIYFVQAPLPAPPSEQDRLTFTINDDIVTLVLKSDGTENTYRSPNRVAHDRLEHPELLSVSDRGRILFDGIVQQTGAGTLPGTAEGFTLARSKAKDGAGLGIGLDIEPARDPTATGGNISWTQITTRRLCPRMSTGPSTASTGQPPKAL